MSGKLQFCPDCDNLLYPKERDADHKLIIACKHCTHQEDSPSRVIYKNAFVKDTAMRLDLIDTALAKDPTLPRTFDTSCPQCGNNEAVFFMSRSGGKDSDMALVFLCCNEACGKKWMN